MGVTSPHILRKAAGLKVNTGAVFYSRENIRTRFIDAVKILECMLRP